MATDKFEFEKNTQKNDILNYDFKAQVGFALDELLSDRIMDIMWDRFFYYFSQFDGGPTAATGSWNSFVTGTGAVTFSAGAAFSTGATSGSIANISNVPSGYPDMFFLDADKSQRFRVSFSINSIANTEVYIVKGVLGDTCYGFKITNGAISGVVENGGGEQLISLNATVDETRNNLVEARLNPLLRKVFFYVDGVERDSIDGANVPSVFNGLAEIQLKNTTASDKTMTTNYFELIQSRI